MTDPNSTQSPAQSIQESIAHQIARDTGLHPQVAGYLLSRPNTMPDQYRARCALLAHMIVRIEAELDVPDFAAQAAALRLSAGPEAQSRVLELAEKRTRHVLGDVHGEWQSFRTAATSLVVARLVSPESGGRVRAGCPHCGERYLTCDGEGAHLRTPDYGSADYDDPEAPRQARTTALGALTQLNSPGVIPGGLTLGTSAHATRELWWERLALWSWMNCETCGHEGWLPGFVSTDRASGPLLKPGDWRD